jgi:hypothetical protein
MNPTVRLFRVAWLAKCWLLFEFPANGGSLAFRT